jgi:hypothetical protein
MALSARRVRSSLQQHGGSVVRVAPQRRLDVESRVREREEVLHVLARDVSGVARLGRETLDLDALAGRARLLLDLLVLANAVQEVVTAGRLLHVLDADVDLLADDAVAVELVHLQVRTRTRRGRTRMAGCVSITRVLASSLPLARCIDCPLLSFSVVCCSYLDTDGARGDVPDDTGLTVVELVRETLLHGSVTLDVDELSNEQS